MSANLSRACVKRVFLGNREYIFVAHWDNRQIYTIYTMYRTTRTDRGAESFCAFHTCNVFISLSLYNLFIHVKIKLFHRLMSAGLSTIRVHMLVITYSVRFFFLVDFPGTIYIDRADSLLWYPRRNTFISILFAIQVNLCHKCFKFPVNRTAEEPLTQRENSWYSHTHYTHAYFIHTSAPAWRWRGND